MGRKRKAGIMLPRHVHAVTWRSGRVAYYWQKHRGTSHAGPRIRLPDDPSSAAFWQAVKALQDGARPPGGIAAMIDAYQASPHYLGLADATRREYARYMASLRAAIGDRDTAELMPKDVAELRDAMGETPAKANAYIRAIAALYRWGRERGLAQANPADGIRKLKIGEYQPWPEWAWLAAMAHFRPEIRAACILGRHTGQRLGDILRLKLTDISTDTDGTDGFNLVQQKTGKALFVPVAQAVRPVIAEARRRGHICLVAREDGSPFTVDQFHAMWGREMQREALKPIREAGLSFHGLRKSFAVAAADAGISGKGIGSLTGQSLPVVEHYSKGADQKRLAKSAMKTLEGHGK